MQIIADIGKNFITWDWKEQLKTGGEILTDLGWQNATKMIRLAKESGATVAKFQTHVFEDEKIKRDKSRYNWIEFNEQITPIEFWEEMKNECDEIGIEFMTTPMSKMAAQKVNHLVKRWKVSSADIVDFELLKYLKETKKPIIISTGMSTEGQIDKVVDYLGDQIEFINYCVSIYPCPIYKIDLSKMIKLKDKYNLSVGFSDHSLSIEVPTLAVRMGAVAVEKHFTLDRNVYGPDHKASLLPEEFKKMVDLCKLAETDSESFEEEKKHWDNFRAKVE